MSGELISVIIVTAGRENYFRSCLDSVGEQTYSPIEIAVIDNSLNREFSRIISQQYPRIKIYLSQKNIFYCAALNKGIEMVRGDFILCLNDDVVLDKRFIQEALRGFYIACDIGMVSGKILRSQGKILDSTGLFLSPWRTAKERGYGIKDEGQYEKEEYIFGVNGAAAFYRHKMLEEIKIGSDYFDSDYHIFYEDLDISWRGKKRGWKTYYVPTAIAYHVRGATVRLDGGVNKPFARRYLSDDLHFNLVKNRYLTLIKNESYLGFLLHLPFILFYDLWVWGYILIFRPRLFKKFILNLKILKLAFAKRKLIKKEHRNTHL